MSEESIINTPAGDDANEPSAASSSAQPAEMPSAPTAPAQPTHEEKAAAAEALAAAVAAQAEKAARGESNAEGPLPIEDSVGLGVDIVEIERMKRILERTPRFKQRVYTEEERIYCEKNANPAVHYATRFAAKEAVLKALGTGFAHGIAPADVEVSRNQAGRPIILLHRKAARVSDELGVREIPVSLSYTHTEAVACAMAITARSIKAAEERKDPMEELTKQFKEMRTMLDELPVTEDANAGNGVTEAPSAGDDAAEAANAENYVAEAPSAGNDGADAPSAGEDNA